MAVHVLNSMPPLIQVGIRAIPPGKLAARVTSCS
jgi:hypothetical protein